MNLGDRLPTGLTLADAPGGSASGPTSTMQPTPSIIVAKTRDFRPRAGRPRGATPFVWGGASYSLPAVACVQLEGEGHDADAVATLQHISAVVGRREVPLDGYLAHREEWLAANFCLNTVGCMAPRFRPALDPKQIPVTLAQATYGCDRQVIDLHWLHCTGMHVLVHQAEFMNLLADDEFDFELAATFARANVTVERKVETWLALPEAIQWQLAGLQTVAVRKRWAAIRWGDERGTPCLAQVTARLQLGRSTGLRVPPDEVAARWAVEKMLPSAPASERARLFALARGLTTEPLPHVFQRQQDAAMRLVTEVLKR